MRWKAFLIALALLLAAGFASAQNPSYIKNLEKLINRAADAPKEAEEEEADPDETLIAAVLDRTGRVFERGDADGLEECLVRGKRKVFLSLAAGGKDPSHYGTSQLKFIFDEIFREVRTRSFVYDSRDIDRYNGIAIVRAGWTYNLVSDDELVTEQLQFKLQKDEAGWRIFEIRAATR